MRLLENMITKYIGEECKLDSHVYSESGRYSAPKGVTVDEWTEHVGLLPVKDQIEVFGLPEAALW
jgi:hypothetical protein